MLVRKTDALEGLDPLVVSGLELALTHGPSWQEIQGDRHCCDAATALLVQTQK